MEKRYYIAYGSNLNVRQMIRRCPEARVIGTGTLEGWELLFKGSKTGPYLTIEQSPDGLVPVAVWEVSERDERNLDVYEGYPNFYYKKEMTIHFRGIKTGRIRKRRVFVYIMHENRPLGLPTGSYIRTCAEGYDDFNFDIDILFNAINKTREATR